MACLPGMPCFGNHPNNPSPITCGVDPCFTYKTTTDLAHYVGPNLPCIDVNTCETLTSIIQKIDYALCGENLAQTFIDTLLTNTTLYNLFCSQVIQNCITCDYMKDCITCDYINDCIPPCPPCPTTSTTSTSTTAIPYYCYMATAASTATYSLQWTDPIDGLVVITLNNQTVKFCAQQGSVYYNWVSGTGNFNLIGGVSPCTASPDCWEQFTMQASNVTLLKVDRLAFNFGNDSPVLIEWGDGTETFLSTSPATDVTHTYDSIAYPSGYTGNIVIKCADLTNITALRLEDVFGTNVPPTGKSLTITGPEITKLDGLTELRTRWATLNCTTLQLPRTITTLSAILGNVSGDLADFPTNIVNINLGNYTLLGTTYLNSNTVSGNVQNFKSTLRSIAIAGNNNITGNINNMPTNVKNLATNFSIYGVNTISGSLSTTFASNSVMTRFIVDGENTLGGDLDTGFANATLITYFLIRGYSNPSGTVFGAFGNKPNLGTLILENINEDDPSWNTSSAGNTLTGDIDDLPKKLAFTLISGCNEITGDIATMPYDALVNDTYFNIKGKPTLLNPTAGNTIYGDIQFISTKCKLLVIGGANTLEGDIANLPTQLTRFVVSSSANISLLVGNLWDIPCPDITQLEISGNHGVTTYVPSVAYPTLTPTKTWAANMNWFRIINSAPVYFSANDIDQLLVDLDATTWATTSSYPKQLDVTANGNNTAFSAAAYTNLSTVKGVSINLFA